MAGFLRLLVYLVFIGGIVSAQTDQDTINYLANYLQIRYDVVSNFAEGDLFDAKITFTNTGSEPIPAGEQSWNLYFCHIRLIDPQNIRNGGSDLGNSGLKAYHVNGCLHSINATSDFTGIPAGQQLEASFQGEFWIVSKTDVMPNWYVTASGADARVIESTAGESLDFVGDFDSEEKWKRTNFDTYNPYTGPDRYEMFEYMDLGSSQHTVIPTPVQEELNPDVTVNIGTGDWIVALDESSFAWEAQYLADKLATIVVNYTSRPSNRYIAILSNDLITDKAEGYEINVMTEPRYIQIEAKDAPGAWYAIQSLLSMRDHSMDIPSGSITDYPRFGYRGMHIDVGRNFHSKDDVMRLLDVMSMYKLNKLHFHLTEDEGWRLEIPGLPELTTVGANRCHDVTGDECILPQVGSSPLKFNDGSGYYTVDEYKEILTYANMRHIQVIPEFDMPGHAHAAINAMLARYRKLVDSDPRAAEEFLLSDWNDSSDYLSTQYFTDNAINPCVNGTYNFVRRLVREVKAIHESIQPLTTFHFGGDEVPPGAWVNSSACASLGLYTREEIKERLIVGIAQIVADEDLELSGWEDGFARNGTVNYDPNNLATTTENSYVWENVWEWGAAKNAYEFANHDYKVILTPATHLYFDHPYEPDPEERGYYWATRISPMRKGFGFMPDSMYDNIDVDRFGNVLNKDEICQQFGCPPLEESKRENILGIQGAIWCETVRKSDQLEYMVYPRLLALAERAWHKATWETIEDPAERDKQRNSDWEKFTNTLGYKELARLDAMAIQYGVPSPGARVTADNVIEVKSMFPGLVVQDSSDGGQSWSDVTPGKVLDGGDVLIVARSANRARMSRSVTLQVPPLVAKASRQMTPWLCIFLTFILGAIHI